MGAFVSRSRRRRYTTGSHNMLYSPESPSYFEVLHKGKRAGPDSGNGDASTSRNLSVRALVETSCPSLMQDYKPSWWLRGGHVQTAFCVVGDFTRVDEILYERTLLSLPDGGTIGLDFTPRTKDQELPPETPIVVVLHGLSGGSHESYVRSILSQVCASPVDGGLGYRAVVVNFRGWFSLGANVLVRYLGEEGEKSRLDAGCALGCPWNLVDNSRNLEGSFFYRNIYSRAMGGNLLKLLSRHLRTLAKLPPSPLTPHIPRAFSLRNPTLKQVDAHLTIIAGGHSPPFPFPSPDEYYEWARSDTHLGTVRVPLLAINAADDPIVRALPVEAALESKCVVLAVTPKGGHLGWFEGGAPWRRSRPPLRWIRKPVTEWIAATLEVLTSRREVGEEWVEDENGFTVERERRHVGFKVHSLHETVIGTADEAQGHVSCKSCLDSMIAADRGGSGTARLHVDLGAVPSEVASSDGSETVNGDDEDEARSLARESERLATAIANAVFEQNEEKIKSASETGQQWIKTQSQIQRTARFPVLRALSQLAVGNMQNYHACQQLEQKLLDSRANVAQLMERLQTLADVDQRDRQNFEKIRALEQERDDLRVTLTTMERSLRTTTSSLADATASLAESDTALAAAKVELEARDSIRTELEARKAELETTQAAKEELQTSLSKTKKELSNVKHELKQLRADQDHAAPHTLKDNVTAADTSGAGGSMPEKLARRRSRKISHSAPKVLPGEDGGVGKKLDGSRPKKSRHAANGDQTEDERKGGVETDDPSKSGEPSKSKGHSKDKERKERGRDKHRGKDHGEGKLKDKGDDDQPLDSELAGDGQPGVSDSKPSGEKPHKSGRSRKKTHITPVDDSHPLERSASAPPGTEADAFEALKVSTDSLPHSKAGSSKSPDPISPPAASGTFKGPPTTAPRRGLVETLTKGRDGLLRRAMGRKQPSNMTNDLGSASTVVNMKPAPGASPAGSSSSGPSSSLPAADPTFAMSMHDQTSSDPVQAPRTVAYTTYPLPGVENIAGFGIPGVVHEMAQGPSFSSYPAPPHSGSRSRGQTTSVPRTSEDRGSDGYDREFTWPYESWDQSRSRGKGRDREDRHERKRSGHRRGFSNEWHGEEGVAPVRHYVAADEVPSMSRHGFGDIPFGESPPAYPLYEQFMDALPRKASFANLRGMK
ncbi:unnamed protein product [Rhizoctonia solani]|uniref:Uncharacterized protein n=1 Tax=Rhizoctonia solani TaxID=456999 RepID=A0A8H2XCB3_9AGAM|nr:unnamed protein product [Rhizoctonia solani]